MARRRYSDEERAATLAALDANGGNVARTARQAGVPRKTLEEWADGKVAEGVAELRQGRKLDLADRLEALAGLLVGDLADEASRKGANFRDKAVSMGIAIDKFQLLRGEPTNIQAAHLTLEQANRADDELERWRGGRLSEGEVSG